MYVFGEGLFEIIDGVAREAWQSDTGIETTRN